MKVLGIETACDDSAAAVVEDGHNILSNVIWNQNKVHQKFGGIVPELAARRHVETIGYAIEEALDVAGVTLDDIDAVAVNTKRGLLRSLVTGVSAAKAIALAKDIPLITVHHVKGHIQAVFVTHPEIQFPAACLTVSGGHNYLIYMPKQGSYELVGNTLDDAAGEAYDKIARFLGLGFPGGPILDKLAAEGNPEAYEFPRPMLRDGYDFSFSGLKTAVVNAVKKQQEAGEEVNKNDVAASFEAAVVEVLTSKVIRLAKDRGAKTVIAVGGVALNPCLRQELKKLAEEAGMEAAVADGKLCTDNAVMIASLGYQEYTKGAVGDLNAKAYSNAPLDS